MPGPAEVSGVYTPPQVATTVVTPRPSLAQRSAAKTAAGAAVQSATARHAKPVKRGSPRVPRTSWLQAGSVAVAALFSLLLLIYTFTIHTFSYGLVTAAVQQLVTLSIQSVWQQPQQAETDATAPSKGCSNSRRRCRLRLRAACPASSARFRKQQASSANKRRPGTPGPPRSCSAPQVDVAAAAEPPAPLAWKPALKVPFASQTLPKVLIACGLSGLCVYLNSWFNIPPLTASPVFQAEQARIGMVMTRTDAPPVYLNPISNGIPGNVRGPEDVE
eukprot:gene7410-7619_t